MEKTATLHYQDKKYELPVLVGAEKEVAVQIKHLRKESGLITLDSGYLNTGATESSITFIDGAKGILRYRGYDIGVLCEKSTFLEVTYLLNYGELPTKKQLDDFTQSIKTRSMINEEYKKYYDVWPQTAEPMALLASAITCMSSFYATPGAEPEQDLDLATIRLISKTPTMAAYAYKKSIGQPFIYPKNNLSYAANFLNMMHSVPCEEYEIDPIFEKALDQLLILHADHEQNCSTSAVRLVGSSKVNIYASMAAGILALWGPLHGGANEAVLNMLRTIEKEGGGVQKFIEKAKDPKDPFRLMGFGHRVYKNFDPRAMIIKGTCKEILEKKHIADAQLDIAQELEEKALQDSYFIERKLFPNVDFYSGIIYRAMKIPINMFTVMFALGRMAGWIAHWKEMYESPGFRIDRPRQIYQGATLREYTPIEKR
jgi:citrate synthase